MKITALVENQTNCELKSQHGLSLYIETKKHKLLFDVGSDNALFENAKKRGIDLTKVDIVVISHGHIDHGGDLKRFLKINSTAKIYLQATAFEPHYNKFLFLKINVGIDKTLKNHPQIILVEGDFKIDEELQLVTTSQRNKCHSPENDCLYDEKGKDTFLHEQNLIISESKTAIFTGCGHAGIVNIMETAKKYRPLLCVGGYHLFNPVTKKTVEPLIIDEIANELQAYPEAVFYTCHCTGTKAFMQLSQKLPNLFYLSCGEKIEF